MKSLKPIITCKNIDVVDAVVLFYDDNNDTTIKHSVFDIPYKGNDYNERIKYHCIKYYPDLTFIKVLSIEKYIIETSMDIDDYMLHCNHNSKSPISENING